MATLLQESTDAESPISPLSINPFTGLLEQHPIKEPSAGDPAPVPARILVRQIGLDPVAEDGPFVFVDPDQARPYTAGTLDTILDNLRQGIYTPTTLVNGYNRPLDVNCRENTQFIFFLRDLGEGRRWRFSSQTKGVTLGWFEEPADRENYYSLRHVLDDSVGSPDPYPHPQDCKIITFIARRTSDNFKHAFNINVEFVFDDDESGMNTLPVVIDPDIRHPGGSGE